MTGKNQTFAPFNPVCQNWVAQSVECIAMKEVIEVNILGSYKEAEGKFSYRFYPDGEITVSYNFTLLQDISPRQTGLVFTVPHFYNQLNGNVKDIGMPTRKIISALWKEQQKLLMKHCLYPVWQDLLKNRQRHGLSTRQPTAPIFSVQPKRIYILPY